MTGTRQPTKRTEFKPRDRNMKLIELRLNAGLSRVDLSRRSRVSIESIRLAELGFIPGPQIQFALASAFKQLPLDIWPFERQRIAA